MDVCIKLNASLIRPGFIFATLKSFIIIHIYLCLLFYYKEDFLQM